jgi:hypothetical protein
MYAAGQQHQRQPAHAGQGHPRAGQARRARAVPRVFPHAHPAALAVGQQPHGHHLHAVTRFGCAATRLASLPRACVLGSAMPRVRRVASGWGLVALAARSQGARRGAGLAGSVDNSRGALHFANTAKAVTMRPVLNEVRGEQAYICRMEAEIQELRRRLVRSPHSASGAKASRQDTREREALEMCEASGRLRVWARRTAWTGPSAWAPSGCWRRRMRSCAPRRSWCAGPGPLGEPSSGRRGAGGGRSAWAAGT